MWATMTTPQAPTGANSRSPASLFYQLLLAFIADEPLESAVARSKAIASAPAPEMRTPRRSATPAAGCARHVLRYLLCSPMCGSFGLQEWKLVSLAMRMQYAQ